MTGRSSADDPGLPLAEWKRIDDICSAFEAAWAKGERPDPAAFLGDAVGATRDRLFRELLAIEVDSRRSRGEQPLAPEYRERFPDHEEAIDETFASIALSEARLPSIGLRGRLAPIATTGAPKFGEAGFGLPPAELNAVVADGLRSAGYEVLGELGRGGMGVVYLARKLQLNRLCALKMILAGAHAGSVIHARFRAEAEAVAKLRHPDIVQIYHVGEVEGLPYLELEYLHGGGLDLAIKGTARPPAAAASLVEIMARAIEEAHQLGIVHRDLKPANVLLDRHGRPKVADFGLAKILGSEAGLTRTSAVVGSPSYMAPEQAEGDGKMIGPRTDVYALGAILYELLTGRPPFRAATAIETLAHVKNEDPVPPSRIQLGLPGEIETICLKCLEKQPARRYATALALAEDLRRYQAGEPILAQDPAFWLLIWKRAKRRPALSAALVVSAAAILLLCGGSLYYNARLADSVEQARDAERAARHQSDVTTKALNELVFGVQDQLGKTAATRALRKGLLDTALDGLDQVALSAAAAAPDLSRAVAHQKLGDIFKQVGRNDNALTQYEFSEDVAARLALASPGDRAIAQCLARSHAGLAELCLNANRPKDAVEHCRQVVQLAEKDAEINTDRTQARLALLEGYFRLGRAYGFDRDLEQAEVWFRKMESLAERWIGEEPASIPARDQLATSHRKIADVRKLAGDHVAARTEYWKAVNLGHELHLADGKNLDVKLHLAQALDDQAMTLRKLGLLEEASPLEREAEGYFNELVQADPEDVDNRVRLYQTQCNLGCLLMDRLQLAEATALLGQALDGLTALDREGKLAGRPRDRAQLLPLFQTEKAACLALAAVPAQPGAFAMMPLPEQYRLRRIQVGLLLAGGQLDDVPAWAESLCAMNSRDPDELYELGRSLAWCAGRIDNLGARGAGSQNLKTLREKLAERAVAAVEHAASSGLGHLDRALIDGFLDPVREHPGIRRISESLRTASSGSGNSPNRESRSATTQTRRP
jgi:eukaryotic-like serine/threonine-protein kinase